MFRRSPKPAASAAASQMPQVTAQPRAGSVSSGPLAGQTMSAVQTAQFEEAIPNAIVPPALSETSTGAAMDLPTPMVEYGSGVSSPAEAIAPPPAMEVTQPTTSVAHSPSYTSPVEPVEHVIQSYPPPAEGQLFDLPITNVLAGEAAETYSTGNWFRGGNWYTRQEMVMLLRADLPHQHIAVDRSSGSFEVNAVPSISTKDTDFTYEAGTRLTLGHRLGRDPANRDHSIEFTFFGLFDYTGRTALTPINPENGFGIVSLIGSEESRFNPLTNQGSSGFQAVDFIDGMIDNTRVDVLHQADFNSYEFNYVVGARPAQDRLVLQPDGRWVRHATPSRVRGLFAGFRYISQDEFFQYLGVGQNGLNNGAQEPENDLGSTYRVSTSNDLFGVQLGGEYIRKRTDWVFGLKGKVGGLLNFADRNNFLSQTTASTETQERVVSTEVTRRQFNDETLTFLSEASMYMAYFVRPNTSFRVGYDVIYLNGLATATNNLNIRGDEFARFELTGDSFYHGMNLGCEFTW